MIIFVSCVYNIPCNHVLLWCLLIKLCQDSVSSSPLRTNMPPFPAPPMTWSRIQWLFQCRSSGSFSSLHSLSSFPYDKVEGTSIIPSIMTSKMTIRGKLWVLLRGTLKQPFPKTPIESHQKEQRLPLCHWTCVNYCAISREKAAIAK